MDRMLEGRLVAMRSKYQELVALREGAPTPEAPRARLRALAQRFPGALRELDRRPLSQLHSRIDELKAALCHGSPPPWFQAQDLYHAFMRAALCLRPRLRTGIPVSGDELDAAEELGAAGLGPAWLQQIAQPPTGRLNVVAYAYVAECLGLSPTQVTAYLDP